MEKSHPDKLEKEFILKQQEICKKYEAEYVASPFDKIIGVAIASLEKFEMPINGLRHPKQTEHSENWYIWAGKYSEADDFFKPVHVYHLLELCPKAINYLGLAPGWRFLFDNKYEDVWYDSNLLFK